MMNPCRQLTSERRTKLLDLPLKLVVNEVVAFRLQFGLERFAHPNVDGLVKGCATDWDVLYFAPHVFDLDYDLWHRMAPVGVQEKDWLDVGRCQVNVWLKDVLNPHLHHSLVHPRVLLDTIDAMSVKPF